jgi:chromatin structure-remodeling complex subunit RSC1/2
MEIDVETNEMTPEVETTWSDDASGAKDEEGEEIVRQLEKSLPKWEGYGEKGWMTEGSSVSRQNVMRR